MLFMTSLLYLKFVYSMCDLYDDITMSDIILRVAMTSLLHIICVYVFCMTSLQCSISMTSIHVLYDVITMFNMCLCFKLLAHKLATGLSVIYLYLSLFFYIFFYF